MFSNFQINQELAQQLSLILTHAVWQGVLVWLVLLLLMRALRHKSAAIRYTVLVSGLWLVLLCPILTWLLQTSNAKTLTKTPTELVVFGSDLTNLPSSIKTVAETKLTSKRKTETTNDSTSQMPDSARADSIILANSGARVSVEKSNEDSASSYQAVQSWLILLWVAGVTFLSSRLALGYIWTLKIASSRIPVDAKLSLRIEQLCKRRGWKHWPRVYLSNHLKEGIVVGFLRPVVLLPVCWTTQMAPATLEAVILHELIHIRRFDLWIILVQRIAETLLFFHPGVWWLSHRISVERELCCDAEAVHLLDSNLSYAKALQQVAQQLLDQTQSTSTSSSWLSNLLSLHFGGQKMELLSRIQHVLKLDNQPISRLPRRSCHGGFMLSIPMVILGMGLSLVHVMAEEPLQKNSLPTVSERSQDQFVDEIQFKNERSTDSATDQLMFGVGINSDAGVIGQLAFNEEELNSEPSASKELKSKWNKKLEESLNQIAEIEPQGASVEEALNKIGEKYFQQRLEIDESELRKSGLTFQQELDAAFSGITLRSGLRLILEPNGATYYIDQGKLTVTSLLKAKYHRVYREYDVAEILKFEEFFLQLGEQDTPEDRIENLIDFLITESGSWVWNKSDHTDPIVFDQETKHLKVLVPQSMQKSIQGRLQLLDTLVRGEQGPRTRILYSKVLGSFDKQDNCILKHLRQQRIQFTHEEILKKLQQRTSVDYENEDLSKLLEFIANNAGINIVVDELALREVGITSNEKISVRLEDVSFSNLLDVTLRSFNLTTIIEDEVLKITSIQRAQGELIAVVYAVKDLISEDEEVTLELQRLRVMLKTVIAPESWDEVGGSGAMVPHPGTKSLVVRQVRSIHEEMSWLLQQIRNVRAGEEAEVRSPAKPPLPEALEDLKVMVNQKIQKMLLQDILSSLSAQTKVQFYLDQQGLAEAGVTKDSIVHSHIENKTLQAALGDLLKPLGLEFQVYENVVVITSTRRSVPLEIRLYSTEKKFLERRGLREVCNSLKDKFQPESWDVHGGEGTVTFDGKSRTLIIRQSAEVHEQLAVELK